MRRIIAIAYRPTRAQAIRLIAQVSLLLLVIGSLQPGRPGPLHAIHREIHYAAFGGTTLLLLLLCRTRLEEVRVVVAACFLGLSLEYLQHLIYHNPAEWWDVRDDAFAILAAFVAYYLGRACANAVKSSRLLALRPVPKTD